MVQTTIVNEIKLSVFESFSHFIYCGKSFKRRKRFRFKFKLKKIKKYKEITFFKLGFNKIISWIDDQLIFLNGIIFLLNLFGFDFKVRASIFDCFISRFKKI